MINLKNIHIAFDREIISDGEMQIPDESITAITGESGSGKTSLLYMVGLLSSNKDYSYEMDGSHIDFSDKEHINQIRRSQIGILFQDGSLIESLRVGENIKWSAQLAGLPIDDEGVSELLSEVELPKELHALYPAQLSGGERQRASLAMVMAKQTKYILADEPTAALDQENTNNIKRILQKFVSNGRTVVIATHNSDLCEMADRIYHIENHKITLIKDNPRIAISHAPETAGEIEQARKIKWSDLFYYATQRKRKGKILRLLLVVFCSIAISGMILTSSVLRYMNETQKDLLNQLSDREIFVVNQMTSTDGDVKDKDGNPVIAPSDLSRIRNIDGVDTVYPLVELRSFSINGDPIVTDAVISVQTDETTYPIRFSLNDRNMPSYFVVLPYFPEQKYEKQLGKTFESNDGVYLSYDLANELGLTDSSPNSVNLDFQIGIPVKKYKDAVTENDETVPADIDIVRFVPMRVDVSGILSRNVTNRYTINGNRVIYIPYEKLNDFLSANFETNDFDFSTYADYDLLDWGPSACVVYTNSYRNIEVVKGKIENINTNLTTRYDYQDADSMDQITQTISGITDVALTIVMLIVFALMTALFVHSTVSRKREYAILKGNGMTGGELQKLTVLESTLSSLKILLLSSLLSVFASFILGKSVFHEVIFFSPDAYFSILPFVILFVMLPSIGSVMYVNQIQVDKIIRG